MCKIFYICGLIKFNFGFMKYENSIKEIYRQTNIVEEKELIRFKDFKWGIISLLVLWIIIEIVIVFLYHFGCIDNFFGFCFL